jgi:hypothetical protein
MAFVTLEKVCEPEESQGWCCVSQCDFAWFRYEWVILAFRFPPHVHTTEDLEWERISSDHDKISGR